MLCREYSRPLAVISYLLRKSHLIGHDHVNPEAHLLCPIESAVKHEVIGRTQSLKNVVLGLNYVVLFGDMWIN
jgi:hypothetical protein